MIANNQTELRKQVGELLKRPENKECADCTERLPKWAVVNHGIFVCLNCSGQHRNIGAHISKVKSATLDDWEPAEVEFMAKMGNVKANSIFLANLPQGMSKPLASDDRGREKWIKTKYVQRKWVGQPAQAPSPNQAPTMASQQPTYAQYNPQSFSQAQPQAQPKVQQQALPQFQQTASQPNPQVQSSFSSFAHYAQQQQQVQQRPQPQSQWGQANPQPQWRPSQPVPYSQVQQTKPQLQWGQQPQQQQQTSPQPSLASLLNPQQTSTFGQNQWDPQQMQSKYGQNPSMQPRLQPAYQQPQPQPQAQVGGGVLIDFSGPVKQQPKAIDPQAGNQLMSCFGGQPKW